jgi:hypothetical protein
MDEDQDPRDPDHKGTHKTAAEVRLEALQKTLHHIEATKHILEVSGVRPEPVEVTLRNLEKLLNKGHAQVRAMLTPIEKDQ